MFKIRTYGQLSLILLNANLISVLFGQKVPPWRGNLLIGPGVAFYEPMMYQNSFTGEYLN